MVKNYITTATTEIEKVVDNLQKNIKGKGRKHCPNFEKCMSKNQFKAFLGALRYCFCEETYWRADEKMRNRSSSFPIFKKISQ